VDDRITDAGFRHLARIQTLKSLRIVDATKMTDAGLKELGRLPNLEALSLTGAPVTDEGVRAFLDQRGGTLQSLSLSTGPITDHALADLPAQAPNLRSLHVWGVGITDRSVGPLSQLSHLEELILSDTSVTLAGAETLRQRLPNCRVRGPGPLKQ
jgi:hypothetical protein